MTPTIEQFNEFQDSFKPLWDKYKALSENARTEIVKLYNEFRTEEKELQISIYGEARPDRPDGELSSPVNPFPMHNRMIDLNINQLPTEFLDAAKQTLADQILQVDLSEDELYAIATYNPNIFDIAHKIYKTAKTYDFELERLTPVDENGMTLLFFIQDHFIDIKIKTDLTIDVHYEVGVGTECQDMGSDKNVPIEDILGILMTVNKNLQIQSTSAYKKLTPEEYVSMKESQTDGIMNCQSIAITVTNQHGAYLGVTIPSPTQEQKEAILPFYSYQEWLPKRSSKQEEAATKVNTLANTHGFKGEPQFPPVEESKLGAVFYLDGTPQRLSVVVHETGIIDYDYRIKIGDSLEPMWAEKNTTVEAIEKMLLEIKSQNK